MIHTRVVVCGEKNPILDVSENRPCIIWNNNELDVDFSYGVELKEINDQAIMEYRDIYGNMKQSVPMFTKLHEAPLGKIVFIAFNRIINEHSKFIWQAARIALRFRKSKIQEEFVTHGLAVAS